MYLSSLHTALVFRVSLKFIFDCRILYVFNLIVKLLSYFVSLTFTFELGVSSASKLSDCRTSSSSIFELGVSSSSKLSTAEPHLQV